MHSMPSPGKQLWKYEPKLGAESFKTACCDVINRGVALYGKNVYVAMLSGDVAALDAQTGALVWKKADVRAGSRLRVLARAARARRRARRRQFRRRIRRARLHRRARSRRRQRAVEALHGARRDGEERRHLAQGHAGTWRRARVADGHLRRGIEDALLGRRQSGTVARGPASGRQSLLRLAARARSENRRPQVALPIHAPRHLGLRRRQYAGTREHQISRTRTTTRSSTRIATATSTRSTAPPAS